MTKLDKITSEGWEVEFDDLFGVGGAYNNENLWEVFGSIKQFISQEKQLSKQEERARIIPKIHKIRAGCPANSFARQQAKELLKELMGVEK